MNSREWFIKFEGVNGEASVHELYEMPCKEKGDAIVRVIEKSAYDEAVKFINWLENRFEPDRKYSTGAREILAKIDEWKSFVGG